MLGFFTKDWPRKLTAIFFALLIWFTVSQQIQEVRTYHDIVIELNPENGDVFFSEKQRPIIKTITVRGTKSDVALLKDSKSIPVKVSIPELDPEIKTYTFTLSDDNFDFPSPTISIEQIVPKQFNIKFDRIVTKKVRVVEVHDKINIPKNAVAIDFTIRPKEVTIKGPSEILKDIDSIETEQFVIPQKSTTRRVKLKEQENVEILVNSHVEIDIMMTSEIGTDAINVPLQILNSPNSDLGLESVLSNETTILVTLKGPQAQLDKLDQKLVKAYIEIEPGDQEGESKKKVKVHVESKDCKYTNIVPEYVDVKLVKKDK